jgi:hypothetical protein
MLRGFGGGTISIVNPCIASRRFNGIKGNKNEDLEGAHEFK